ncbi:hypothetical protein GGI04_001424 [Coemansia thaxteri]|nr:hypothetical protein GGI04_001424 [Coemansia thaxteri]KAJ2472737.1 hypothetical protein GGI02_001369 [Coemansia sp. RSA 2322]
MAGVRVGRAFRTSVAPMVDVTDPYFLRLLGLISPFGNHQLWTEMIHANAFSRGHIHLDPKKLSQHLPLHELQNGSAPGVVVQIGASNPDDAYAAVNELAKLGVRHVNLNCGCPSRNVQAGSFGAVLMKTPELAADIVRAMSEAASHQDVDQRLAVSVKCRIGIDEDESPEFLRRFLGAILSRGQAPQGNAIGIILHARRAWLSGLSPEQNRTVPQLNPARVYEMIRDFPQSSFVFNGGVDTVEAVKEHLAVADGVMIGRKIREDPWFLSLLDHHIYGITEESLPDPNNVLLEYARFVDQVHDAHGTRYSVLARPLFAFFHGRKGRTLRRHLGHAISQVRPLGKGVVDQRHSIKFSELLQEAVARSEVEYSSLAPEDANKIALAG